MFLKLFLAFTIIPAIELYLLIQIGSVIGTLPTLAIIVLTGVLGAYLAKTQGALTMRKVFSEVNQGKVPAEELLNALIIIIAGVVLITPGFMTDLIGFFLLIPLSRKVIFNSLKSRISNHIQRKQHSNVVEIQIDQDKQSD